MYSKHPNSSGAFEKKGEDAVNVIDQLFVNLFLIRMFVNFGYSHV
jgi:hypothetical protein